MKIYLATDHAGFEMKEAVKLFLEVEKDELIKDLTKAGKLIQNIEVTDFGAYKYNGEDDYPEFISLAAGALSSDIYVGHKENYGIIFGGSGEGEAIVATKYKGIRAGVINTENLELVKLLREHNNANVLSLGARFISENFAKEAVRVFLLTKFIEKKDGQESRHKRRVKAIGEIEENLEEEELGDSPVSKEALEELSLLEAMKDRVKDN